MSKERIHRLLEAGLKKGFNEKYVRKTLLKQGYDKDLIDECLHERKHPPKKVKEVEQEPEDNIEFEDEEPVEEVEETPEPKKESHHHSAIHEKNRVIPYLYLVIVILIVSLGLSLFIRPDVVEHEIIIEKECTEAQIPAVCTADDTPLREKLENYNTLSKEIDMKQAEIDLQLAVISNLNSTLEDREGQLEQQIEELRTINEYIKRERREVVNLLVEVMNYILKQ